jgi:hypothetical protein
MTEEQFDATADRSTEPFNTTPRLAESASIANIRSGLHSS